MVGLALTAPPGLTGFAGARPKPTPVLRLFSLLLPKEALRVSIEAPDGSLHTLPPERGTPQPPGPAPQPPPPGPPSDPVNLPLECLAFGRSGDKGDKANIGILARHPDFLPWIAQAMSAERVADYFEHFLAPGQACPVERFYLPGCGALNFVLHAVLGGGGVASLRADPQGKGYAQLLLAEMVTLPRALAARHGLLPEGQP